MPVSAANADSPDTYSRQARSEKLADKLAVTYSIEVIHDGKVSNVPSSYAFHKGEDVRFHIQSNTDGYMYILASGADKGSFDVIYPRAGEKETAIQKGKDYHLPQKGVKVANSSSLKSVKLVFSKTKLDTEETRGFSFTNVNAEPSLTNTSTGQASKTAGLDSFAGEQAITVTLSNPAKPLGVEISLGEQEAKTAKKGR